MKRLISLFLIASSAAFFQAGCAGVGAKPAAPETRPDPVTDPPWPSLDLTPLVVGAAVTTAVVASLLLIRSRRERSRYALTPAGANVRFLAHEEAPAGAVFLADIHTGLLSRLDYVKNELRNETARLGGDLVVLDDIQQDIRDGQTWGYLGVGRAYRIGR